MPGETTIEKQMYMFVGIEFLKWQVLENEVVITTTVRYD